MSAPPYIPLFAADWTADVQHLTCEEDGAYGRIIRALWRGGGRLRLTPDQFARICGLSPKRWARVAMNVLPLFQVEPDGMTITHKRVTKELEKYAALCARNKAIADAREAAKSLKPLRVV